MAELTTVARPYAKAAFQFARESGQLGDWSAMLALAASAVADPALLRLISNPSVSHQQLATTLESVLGEALDTARRNFVRLLARNKRISAMTEIARLFELYRADLEKTLDVEMCSAFAVSDEQVNALATSLNKRLGKAVNITVSVDPSLIGGAVFRARDLVIDGSVKGKLAKLAENLNY